jgi:hypothetical protein
MVTRTWSAPRATSAGITRLSPKGDIWASYETFTLAQLSIVVADGLFDQLLVGLGRGRSALHMAVPTGQVQAGAMIWRACERPSLTPR